MYSQSKEDEIVHRYFGGMIGTLLEIGANDGITFSNSKMLIEKGWQAHLVEPSPSVFPVLQHLYNKNPRVKCLDVAIVGMAQPTGLMPFYDSGAHVPRGADRALVSTTIPDEMTRWGGVPFEEKTVSCTHFGEFYISLGLPKYQFVSIDAEGCDWGILEQIKLDSIGCKCLCIEWNSKPDLAKLYAGYCAQFGLKEIHRNAENIIFVK